MEIGVAGCGPAGQATATFLARAGHRVTVLERAPTLRPVGAGVLLQPTGMAVLLKLGLLAEILELGSRVESLHGVTAGARGRAIMDLSYSHLRSGLFGLGVQRGVLFSSLLRAMEAANVEIRCGHEATGIEFVGRRTLVRDAHQGVHGPFDLLVVADGSRSSLRGCIGHHRRARPYSWGALWFIAEDERGAYGATLSQVYRGTREMVGFLPSGRLERGGPPTVSMFWSVRSKDVETVREGGLDAWKSRVRALTERADPILEQVERVEDLVYAEYQDVVMPCWHEVSRAPIAFVGDAGHAMSPQLGQGVNLALVDAMTLAECLNETGSCPAALDMFSRRRRRALRYYQMASRWLTPVFQSDLPLVGTVRDAVFGRMARIGWVRRQMLGSLAGIKTGVFSADAIPPLE